MTTRARLDAVLVERGLAATRSRAQAAVMAGRVRVDGAVVTKAGAAVREGSAISVDETREYVSRGGTKLAVALDALGVDVTGARALDLGASTGGFTDCLLQRGAERVVALDVGYGQLAWSLRSDPRVVVMERTNARRLTPADLPYPPDLVTCDLSFIGVGVVWPAVVRCLDPAYRALVLVKPQFEAGPERVGGGVVRDDAVRAATVADVAGTLVAAGGRVAGVTPSGLPGPKGNREVFLHVVGPGRDEPAVDDLAAAIHMACAA